MTIFIATMCPFKPLLGWESQYVLHKIRSEKGGICVK